MKEEDRAEGLGLFAVLQSYAYPFQSFLPFLLPGLPPSPSILKNHSHSCCVSAHAGRNYRGFAPDRLDNFKASLCVGTGGTAKFPRPPGEGEGEEERRQRCWSQ